jgi:hypothetical protein
VNRFDGEAVFFCAEIFFALIGLIVTFQKYEANNAPNHNKA